MNKLILCLLVVSSFSLYAQDEDTVPELNAQGEEITPAEKLATPVATEVHESTPAVIEADAPVVTEETPPVVNDESIPVVTDETPPITVPDSAAPEVKDAFIPPVETPVAVAPPALKVETDMYEKKKFNARASHWLTTFSFEGTKYENIPEGDKYQFDGRKDFKHGFKPLYGGRLGFGGDIYLGAGFVTRSMAEVYYLGTLFSKTLNGGPEAESVEFAYTKQTGQIFGADISQSFGWMFDFKTKNPIMEEWAYLTVETYVEAGIGKAKAYNRTNYNYDTGPSATGAREAYKLTVNDDLLNAKIGGGFNLTSNTGFFLGLKATINRYDITNRKINGFTQENGHAQTPINDHPKDAKIDPVVIYTLGGGYKF